MGKEQALVQMIKTIEEARKARIMKREQALLTIDAAIESFENGTWTFPDLTKAILNTLKYLVEKQ